MAELAPAGFAAADFAPAAPRGGVFLVDCFSGMVWGRLVAGASVPAAGNGRRGDAGGAADGSF
ncbi:MAG: hypothetical protein OXH69_15390 [Acidobacteria bacterium]|nr:hypothetical protein [Acidobacteriota bacterium]